MTEQGSNNLKKLDNVEGENIELVEEVEAMKVDELQENPTQPASSNQSSQQKKRKLEDESTNLDVKDAKKAKMMSIPNWLVEVLEWIKRMEMAGSSLSKSNWTFQHLCWPKLHTNVEPHNVKYLKFLGERDEENRLKVILQFDESMMQIPIAEDQPPSYVTGFYGISIHILDDQIMKFMAHINSKITKIMLCGDLKIPTFYSEDQKQQIQRLFKMLEEKVFAIENGRFCDFLQNSPGSHATEIIENVQSIEEQMSEENMELLVDWLNKKPRTDHKPKFLQFYRGEEREMKEIYIDLIKQKFNESTQAANFLVMFKMGREEENFTMENQRTGEVLALYTNENSKFNNGRQFLVRYAKDQEHLKAEWEKQMAFDDICTIEIDIVDY